MSCDVSSLVAPTRELADEAAKLYIDSYESTHRIVHVPTFWTEYRSFWHRPEVITPDLRLKILLVIGIGSSLCNREESQALPRSTVHQWIYAGQTWLSGPMKKDRLDISGLQIHCLTILARQIFSLGGDLVWMSTGSLVHRAMQMGLHRDPKHLPGMFVLAAEIRRRLWVSIPGMALQSSLDSAMPPRISYDEFNTKALANMDDDSLDETTIALEPRSRCTYTATLLQLLLLDSLPTRLRTLQLLNGLHSELSSLGVLALSAQITEAYQAGSPGSMEGME